MRIQAFLPLLIAAIACPLPGAPAAAQQNPNIAQMALPPPAPAKNLTLQQCRRLQDKAKASAPLAIEFGGQIRRCKARYKQLAKPELPPMPTERSREVVRVPPPEKPTDTIVG